MKFHLKRLLPGLRTLDMFGHQPELTYNGQPAYTTYPGMLVSIILYGLIAMNTVQLVTAFNNGSKQNEKFNQEVVDLTDTLPQYFSDNHFEIAVSTESPISEEMGQYVAYQYMPCKQDDGNCSFNDFLSEPVPFQKCSQEKETEIQEHYQKNKDRQFNQAYASNILCLDMESFYLAGKPETNSEASLVTGFQTKLDIIKDEDHPDFNEDLYYKI